MTKPAQSMALDMKCSCLLTSKTFPTSVTIIRKVERQVSVGCLLHREDIEMNSTKYIATYDNYIYLLGA